MSLRWLATSAENKKIDAILARSPRFRDPINFTPEEKKMICAIYRRPRAPMTSQGCVPSKFNPVGYPKDMTLEEMKADHADHVRAMRKEYGRDGRRNSDYKKALECDDGVLLSNALRELH